jgi:hypothetical protein
MFNRGWQETVETVETAAPTAPVAQQAAHAAHVAQMAQHVKMSISSNFMQIVAQCVAEVAKQISSAYMVQKILSVLQTVSGDQQ